MHPGRHTAGPPAALHLLCDPAVRSGVQHGHVTLPGAIVGPDVERSDDPVPPQLHEADLKWVAAAAGFMGALRANQRLAAPVAAVSFVLLKRDHHEGSLGEQGCGTIGDGMMLLVLRELKANGILIINLSFRGHANLFEDHFC